MVRLWRQCPRNSGANSCALPCSGGQQSCLGQHLRSQPPDHRELPKGRGQAVSYTHLEQKEQEKEPEQPEETTSDNDSRLGKLSSKPSTNVNNMKIQCTGVRESAGYIDGIEVDFKFTNNSDFEQTVWLDSLKVNNKDVEGSLYTCLLYTSRCV